MRWWALLLLSCGAPAAAQPTPVQSVTVAPQSTGSPNDPVLLVGPQKPMEPSPGGDIQRVTVRQELPVTNVTPPKDRCPDGVTEMMSVHLKLGESMELPRGASPVSAASEAPDAIEVLFDRGRNVVRVTARKWGLTFVLVERDKRCTLYGVNAGY